MLPADATLQGGYVLELADTLLEHLVFPGTRPVSIWTKAPGIGKRMAIAEFSERAWAAARKRIERNASAVLRLEARTLDFPNQRISLNVHANPPGGAEHLSTGTVALTCSVPYLRHLSASREKTEALIAFGKQVWSGAAPVYGFGNVSNIPRAPGVPFAEGGPPQLDLVAPPATRVHPIPVAQIGNDIDGNLDALVAGGRGIKGAYWANYLSAHYAQLAGGKERLADQLQGLKVEPLGEGGVLIVATDAPLPEDSEANRARFMRLEAALRPAFFSRAATPANKRALLGEFFRD